MANISRVVACDLGNQHSAFVVANLEPFEIVFIKLFITEKLKDLLEFIDANIKLTDPPRNTLMVYENLYMPGKGGFRNFKLMRIQKSVRAHFEQNRSQVKALIPSQKAVIGGYSKKDKKQKSEEASRQFLTDPDQLRYFESEPRKHDLADAILMARYIYEHK